MPRVRLFHWRAEEAQTLIAALHAGGYTIDYPGEKANGNFRSLRESRPLAAVIDLTGFRPMAATLPPRSARPSPSGTSPSFL